MHCIMFRLSIFTMQLLVIAYHIFYEISVYLISFHLLFLHDQIKYK